MYTTNDCESTQKVCTPRGCVREIERGRERERERERERKGGGVRSCDSPACVRVEAHYTYRVAKTHSMP